MTETANRGRWIKRDFNMGHLSIVLALLGMIGAGMTFGSQIIYQTGRIQATLQDGIVQERDARQQEAHALAERIDTLSRSIIDVKQDVRELRSYVMVKKEFPR